MTTPGPCDTLDAGDLVDVVTLGESMVTFLPTTPGRLADAPSFDRGIGGAESNVACTLAAAGHSARWVSRVGADGFGDHLVEAIGAYGVGVGAVHRDPDRPTGIYFRTAGDRATDAHEVAYYRAGSAASAMSVGNTDLDAVRAGRVLHLSGITAALSADCLDLMRELTSPRPARPLVSFDVNYRPGLWADAGGQDVLLELARGCDIVFVGEDEAEDAWGITGGPKAIRDALPEPAVLVVKQGARGATALTCPRALVESGTAPGPHAPGRSGAAPGSHAPGRSEATPGPHAPGRSGSAPGPQAPGQSWAAPGPQAHVQSGAAPGPHKGGAPSAPGRPTGPRAATSGTAQAAVTGSRDATPEAAQAAGTRLRAAPPGTAQPDVTFVPALGVDVVATVGAGDAFAAGFLSATLRGLPVRERLRHGHLMAAAALTVPGDLAPPPARDHADRLAALDDEAWGTLRLGPGWTKAADRGDEEVRTS